ncbi:hypothetical protein [Archangium lansingense]|uniref:Uncharacterized protein n=1 Tax=Archangium lansingense TaxID=2995310 RepID=A0ABT4A256_9BACT|nr:hypothetical protein [Archangium lansinium]MCY1075733.1 hypothetical protein [Archangium lansinium]
MLTIREAQMDVLAEARFDHLKQWLLPHLRASFAVEVADKDDDTLRGFIGAGVERARTYGATRAATLCKFVHLWVLFGDGLEALPWAERVLRDPSLQDPNTRLEVLALVAREHLAEEEDRA